MDVADLPGGDVLGIRLEESLGLVAGSEVLPHVDSVGKDLDTEKMEAIATLPSPDVPEGKVSIESKKGWMLKDKVLRVAQVVVSSGKPGGEK